MDNEHNDPKGEIERLLIDIAKEKPDITKDIILDIYEVEKELSTLDRRHGIKNRIQTILEEKGLNNEDKQNNS